MSRLSNLKNAEDKYKFISVKDDYTIKEREIIKQWHQDAEERNKKENTTMWKVRGDPKNGLRLVKVNKKKTAMNQQITNQQTTSGYSWGAELQETEMRDSDWN